MLKKVFHAVLRYGPVYMTTGSVGLSVVLWRRYRKNRLASESAATDEGCMLIAAEPATTGEA